MADFEVSDLKETYHNLASDVLLDYLKEGALTNEAKVIAKKELKDRGVEIDFTIPAEPKLSRTSVGLGGYLAGFFFLITALILCYQTYEWLKSETWIDINLVHALSFFGFDLSWAYEPKDWKGFAHIAKWFFDLPVALITFLLACLFSVLPE